MAKNVSHPHFVQLEVAIIILLKVVVANPITSKVDVATLMYIGS
jgi:hypothetical protein